jgi:protoporphyrin/coproporphyrin ferrochelatase
MNLGSPDSTELKDVKRYLSEFLMDGRVIDYPYIFRQLLVNGIIVPFRTKKSAEAYRTIWTKEGSPLIGFTKKLQQKLQASISLPVEIAMRYGNPCPEDAFSNLMKREPEIEEVFAIPLYPHYAMSSFETAVEYTKECYTKNNYPFKLSFARPFYNDKDYIHAMAENIRPFLQQDYDHILFSYHGVPERHIKKSDVTGSHCLTVNNCCEINSEAHKFCYRHQCFETTKLITQELGIDKDKFSNSFQSRLGKGWLQPFTDIRLSELPKEGIKKLLVICPAFVSDCLETLEEIAIRGKETFLEAGGFEYEMIPCLNDHTLWVDALGKWVNDFDNGNRNYIFES